MKHLHLLAAAALGAMALAPASQATTADNVCAPGSDPCYLKKGTTLVVTNGSVLDFGQRQLVLPGGSGTKLDIGSGSVTILAGGLTMNPGSSIVGSSGPSVGGNLLVQVTGSIEVLRDGNSKARIDVSHFSQPGAIELVSGGDIRIEGVVTAQGTQAESGFGTIDMTADGDVLIPGEVNGTGGILAGGGEVVVTSTAGEINVSGIIDASGADGGGIALEAAGRILTSTAGLLSRLDARATAGGGAGGIVDLAAGTDLTLGSPIHAQGEASLFLGGDGGELVLSAGQTLTMNAALNLFGTVPDGLGGDADFFAGLDIVQHGVLDASGKRSFGAGGIVEMLAQRSLILGPLDAKGDCTECAGGDLDLEAWCALSVPAGVTLDAGGVAGSIVLKSGGTLAVAGTVTSGDSIDIALHPDSPAPVLSGTLSPDYSVTIDPLLTPCGGPGVCNHDGNVDEGEECDDGNANACDACSNSCKLNVCGNGRIDAPCEECDDGNTADCDGCRGDCSREDDVCGDAIVECGEQCDPGTAIDCDADGSGGQPGCSAECRLETCGNDVQECDEECDGGPACDGTCLRLPPPHCGDGTTQEAEGEQCDDGNTADCDGCSHLCEEEGCGNNVVECAEECDDGNTASCDDCAADCHLEVCGNGTIDCGEECDDGEQNGLPGSTCLAGTCRTGALCTPESTSTCIPCASPIDCDPLGLCGGADCQDGVCAATTLSCDDANPCTDDTCAPESGCAHTLADPATVVACDDGDPCTDPTCDLATGCGQVDKTDFERAECRLGDLGGMLDAEGIDLVARSALTHLLETAEKKLATARAGRDGGKAKKVKSGLKGARKKMVKFGKKVQKLQPKHIADPSVGAALGTKSGDAVERLDALRAELGV